MGWERYFLLSHWQNAEDANELERRLKTVVRRAGERRVASGKRVDELEADLARVALLARSLAELCLKKGLITPEELTSQLLATDLDDGVGDQGLDPKVVMPGESKLASPRPLDEKPPPPRKRR